MVIRDVKTIYDMATGSFKHYRKNKDPIRMQADRFIRAFGSYGIERQQIIRVLPSELIIPPTAFSTADSLKDYMTPELLNWASDYLALNRSWLDRTTDKPHRHVEGYKNTSVYSDWLKQRSNLEPNSNHTIYIWTSIDLAKEANPSGHISIVFKEHHGELDHMDLNRYWTFTNHWPADHKPCIENMLEIVRIAQSHDVLTVGRVLDDENLRAFENGNLLAPQAEKCHRELWYPEDLTELKAIA